MQDLIPMLSEILNDPFAPSWPPALIAAVGTLQELLRNCWPRIGGYMDDVIKMLTVCWLNLEEMTDNTSQVNSARDEIIKTVKILSAAMKADNVDLSDRVAPVLKTEPGLQRLLLHTSG